MSISYTIGIEDSNYFLLLTRSHSPKRIRYLMKKENEPIRWEMASGFETWPMDEIKGQFASGRVIKDRPKKRLIEVDAGGKTYLAKVYRKEGAFRTLSSGAKADHEFSMSQKLVSAGIPSVPLIARGSRSEEAILLMEKMEGWVDLQTILLDPERSPQEIRERILRYGRFARRLHDAGIWQHDFNPTNILASVDPKEPELKLIDFERMTWSRSLSVGDRNRSLAKMNRIPRLSQTDRMRFLRAYMEGQEESFRKTVREIVMLYQKKIAEDVKKISRLCTREGRRFGVFYTETGKILFRKGDRSSTPEGLSQGNIVELSQQGWPGYDRRSEKDALRAWKEVHREWKGMRRLPVAAEIDAATGEGWVIFSP